MMVDAKSIIYIDTNIIRTEQSWEKDFSVLNPKGDFQKLLDLAELNLLKDKINIGIPKTVLAEFFKSKKENFSNSFSSFKNKIPLFKKMDCFDLDAVKLPEDNFDYQEYIQKVVNQLNNDNNSIKLIDLNWDKSKEILQTIYDKAINNDKPFEKNKGKGKDKGFKDNIIWETIVYHAKDNSYDNHFLLTENTNDFSSELEVEFGKRTNKTIKIVSTYSQIENELNLIYSLMDMNIALKKHIEDEYFISILGDFISEKLDKDKSLISDLNFKKASDFSSQNDGEVIKHPELFNLNDGDVLSVDDLESHYILFYTMKIEDNNYEVEILFDFKNKEIINSYIEELGESDE
jgi:hypothetical protein